MSGNYLRIGRGPSGLWRWWVETSTGKVVYRSTYSYVTRDAVVRNARDNGWVHACSTL